LSKQVLKLPATLRRSLTWDRGPEMAKYKEFTVVTDVQVYFCDPQSSWQRRTNESTNLLCGNTSREEPTSLSTRRRSSIRFRCA
jgi:IS30 family transposase